MIGDDQIILHQTLHGYRDGHRLLNQSVELSQTAAKTLLVMSDASGPNFPNVHPGYITGFPIPDAKCYALAKTWPATEQSRPGCVWTHTILISFSDLGRIKKTVRLLKLFCRPRTILDADTYSDPIVFDLNDQIESKGQMDSSFLENLLLNLYSKPTDPLLISTLPINYDDSWIVSIWDQQWPRLKRTFRFCTYSLADRSVPDTPFDLQIIPELRESRTQWKNYPDHINISPNTHVEQLPEWIQLAVKDLVSPDITTLRDFLWRYGADTEGGRAAYETLAKTWVALESDHDSPDYDMAAAAILEGTAPIPTLTKYLVSTFSKHVVKANQISKTILQFLADNVLAIESLNTRLLIPVAKYLWKHDRKSAWELLKRKGNKSNVMANILSRMMTVKEALEGVGENDKLLAFLITQNTELAGHPEIWQTDRDIIKPITQLTENEPQIREKIVMEMIKTGNTKFAAITFNHFGQSAMTGFIALVDKGNFDNKIIEPWLNVATQHSELLFHQIANGKISKIETLSILSTVINPCHTYPENDLDCWVKAIDALKGEPIEGGIDFCVFLLARSLCRVSSGTSRLAQLGFEPVYNSVSKSQLDYSNWNKIRDLLPHAPWFMDWDWGYRISAGVARLFADQKIPGDEFLKLTTDDKLFRILVDRVKTLDSGQQYLESVLERIPSKGKGITKRRRILHKALSKYH